MVIIEIARECPQLDRLLGEHRWREFLKRSSEQEQDQVTKVFYCTYSTGRQVQKNGESSSSIHLHSVSGRFLVDKLDRFCND